MRIGMIGAGNIGQALARLAIAAGHAAILSNSRGPHTLEALAAEIGCAAAAVPDVPALRDLVVLTVPFGAAFDLPPSFLGGRVVIDTNNYYPDRDGEIGRLERRETTASLMIANHFPGAVIVKAFNVVAAHNLLDGAPFSDEGRRALPIAGDDAAAKTFVATLQTGFGYDTVDTGSLADSWRFERDTPAYGVPLDRRRLFAALAAARR